MDRARLSFTFPMSLVRSLSGAMVAATLALSGPALAQAPLPIPNVSLHSGGGVSAMARQADGKLLVAGYHELAGKDSASGLVAVGKLHRLNTDGTVDSSFLPAPSDTVKYLAMTATHVYVAGSFTSIGGQPIARLAKLSLADGSAVAAWNPAPDQEVSALAVDPDGNVYVAGPFSSIGGVTGRQVVKLDATTGAAVAAWNPSFPDALDNFHFALAVNGSSLYVAGVVSSDPQYLGRLHRVSLATGALDPAFAPPLSAINNQGPVALAFDGTGNVFLGGPGGLLFTSVGQVPAVTLVKLLSATGAVDPAWPAVAEPATALAADGGSLFVGSYVDLGYLRRPQALFKRQLADGAIAAGWSYPVGENNGGVSAIVPTPEGVVIGGDMTQIGTTFAPGMGRVDAATGLPQGDWKGGAFGPGYGMSVMELAGGKLLVGGVFDLVNLEHRAGLARLNADGTLDPTFNANVGGGVWRLLALGSHIYAGGIFTSAGGNAIRFVARFDAATGAVDPAWAPNPDGDVRRLSTDGTDVFVGGPFSTIGGVSQPAIAKISAASGAVVTAFAPPIVNNQYCLGTWGMTVSGGWVYSGCRRYDPNTGISGPRAERFSATTGARDAAWLPNANGSVREILVSGDSVYLVGDFTSVGGQAKTRIAKVSQASGAVDAAWGNAPSAVSLTLAGALVGDHFYVGGSVTTPQFTTYPVMLRVAAATGLHDASWNPGLSGYVSSGYVYSIAPNQAGSQVFAAGLFFKVSENSRSGFAAFATTLDPLGDDDGDGIGNGVEAAEGRNPYVKDNDIFTADATSARLFAMQMYRDFLGREGDAAGIQGWADVVAGGAWTRLQVIDAFLQSQEFAGFVAPVVRLYFATFLRVPDYAGMSFNAGLVRAGTITPTQLADYFTVSPEFAATYGALDDAAFVTLLYNNVLGRAPDPAGLAGWVGLLGSGYTRGQVLIGFSDSTEYQAAMANEVFVTMMYAGMLRRTPEPAGYSGWVGFLDAATYTREQVINGFFLSTEYHNRFLPP